MTTQDEVLKLCEAAGVQTVSDEWIDWKTMRYPTSFEQLTKLINLAKQSAYEDAAKLFENETGALWASFEATRIRNRADEVTK